MNHKLFDMEDLEFWTSILSRPRYLFLYVTSLVDLEPTDARGESKRGTMHRAFIVYVGLTPLGIKILYCLIKLFRPRGGEGEESDVSRVFKPEVTEKV
jgi:hypothetical protein